ncbi:NTP pyrophosphatase (non-canonical NTP hydrolase) [Silvimonas terrae]|uniref:NTP pyrophosphatase (Non-canonical NTP hydrolase) n=1 Tax=Silvimonas terrae TaxID=300266 RepID=A0A840RA98_9NEIS|nr:nucleotide pyrophosphohydrolase [Silvimonas terrae]MBB5189524.1 NTP pyrophosphatase (non-canonical NTP hydrolase) [Silvimonas terrae]
MDLPALQQQLRDFVAARDWARYHTPKNLVMAMSVEMAELVEHFQWLTPEESVALAQVDAKRDLVEQEMADVLLYMLQLADVMNVDIEAAILRKMKLNAIKHPPKV